MMIDIFEKLEKSTFYVKCSISYNILRCSFLRAPPVTPSSCVAAEGLLQHIRHPGQRGQLLHELRVRQRLSSQGTA